MTASLRPFVASLWREHRRAMLMVAAASLALVPTEGIGLLLLIPMLRLVGVSLGEGASDRVADAMESGLGAIGVAPTLAGVLAAVVALVAARAALQWLLAWWEARLEAAVVGRLRERLFAAVVALPWARFAGERPAALVHAIGPQVDDVHSALLMLLQAASLLAGVAAAAAVALFVSPLMTVVVAAAGVLLVVVARGLRAPGLVEGERLLEATTGLFARVSELLGGMKMIHAHDASARAVAAVAEDTRRWSALTQGYARRRAAVNFALAVLGVLLLAALVWTSVSVARVAPATLLLLLLLYARIIPRVAELQSIGSSLAQALASFDSVSSLLARCEAARDAATAAATTRSAAGEGSDPLADAKTRTAPGLATGAHPGGADVPPALEVRGLRVRYPGTAASAIESLDAVFPAGELTVVVGASGAGKTTLGDVLLGLLAPDGGDVLVDGLPLARLPVDQWRSRVAYLAQEPMLFHGTIRENLCFAQPAATEDALRTALHLAACDFVDRLPRGLDAAVGDRGVMLSGGERQRLALARALLRQPQLLVLDEATSALDAATERRILESLRVLRGRCTVVFCTHRPAVAAATNHVVTMPGGVSDLDTTE